MLDIFFISTYAQFLWETLHSFQLVLKELCGQSKEPLPLWGQGLPICLCILEHSRCEGASKAPFYKEGNRGVKRGVV